MKHTITYSIFILFWFVLGSLLAQSYPVDKGSTMIMGSFTFSSSGGDLYENGDGDRLTSFELSPVFGYFVAPGFSIGLQATYSSLSQGDASYHSWSAGPEIAYFFGGNEAKESINGSTYPFLTASYYFQGNSYSSGSSDRSDSGSKLRFGIGVDHLITESVGLFGLFAYDLDSEKAEDGESVSGNQFGIYAGFNIFLY